jgi:hypothetical protein
VGPADHSTGLGGGVRITFLGSSESVQLCWVSVKGCHVRGLPAGSICRAYVNWRGKRTCRGGQVFPCRVYIDSNRRDSRL